MKAYIYHAKETSFRRFVQNETVSLMRLDTQFDCVAVLTTDKEEGEDVLDDAFRLTNHIDRAWWESGEVECKKQSRSTSVGDVVVLEWEDGHEEIWGVAGCGWTKLSFS